MIPQRIYVRHSFIYIRNANPSIYLLSLTCLTFLFVFILFLSYGSWVANSLDFNKDYEASVFETTIRLL